MRRLFLLLLALLASLSFAQTIPVTASRKRALVIGCGAYRRLTPLAYPKADATAVAEALKTGYGFEPGAIRLLTENGTPADEPTAANILAALDQALADPRLDRGDLFVLYFSGHGIGKPTGDYLMPTDVAESDAETKGVPVRGIVDRFVKAGLRNVLVIADACRAGKENPFGADLIRLGREANIGILLGCAPGGRSYEYPALGHGAFTHYLLKALADPALADPATGAVFASTLGERVRRKVKGYTEADHGDAPQVPSVWAEKTQDALLAIYPPKDGPGEGEAGQPALREARGRERLVKYLSAFGEALPQTAEGNLAAANALKALDALGEATAADRYRLLMRLRALGRDAEMGAVSRALARGPESLFRSYGLVVSFPEDVGREVYMGALASLASSGALGANAPVFVDTMLEHRAGASDPERVSILDSFARKFGPGTRPGAWLRARRAELSRDFEVALKLAASGEGIAGETPTAEQFDEVRFDILNDQNRDAEALALADRRVASEGPHSRWRRRALNLARKTKAPDLLARLHAAAADAENPHDLVSLLLSAGSDAPALLPEARAVAARFPYSWEGRVGIWLCEVTANFALPPPFTPEDLKYAPTPLKMKAYAYGKADVLMDEAQDAHRAGGYTGRMFRERLARDMMREPELFETPSCIQAWARLVEGTPRAFESALRMKVAGGKALASNDDGASLARVATLYVFLSGGMPAEARKLYADIRRRGEIVPLATFRMGLALALAGEGAEALKVLADADAETRKHSTYLLAHILALHAAGKKADALSAFDALGESLRVDADGLLLFRIVQHRLGRGQALSNELAEAFADPPRGRLDLVAAAFRQLDEGFAAAATTDPAKWVEEREALAGFAADFPGNPLFAPFRFHAKDTPDRPSDFFGHYILVGKTSFGDGYSDTTYTLNVGSDGVTGTCADGDSPTLPIKGTVDANGNVSALIGDEEHEILLSMKLPPGPIAAETVKRLGLNAILVVDSPLLGGTTITTVSFTAAPKPHLSKPAVPMTLPVTVPPKGAAKRKGGVKAG